MSLADTARCTVCLVAPPGWDTSTCTCGVAWQSTRAHPILTRSGTRCDPNGIARVAHAPHRFWHTHTHVHTHDSSLAQTAWLRGHSEAPPCDGLRLRDGGVQLARSHGLPTTRARPPPSSTERNHRHAPRAAIVSRQDESATTRRARAPSGGRAPKRRARPRAWDFVTRSTQRSWRTSHSSSR